MAWAVWTKCFNLGLVQLFSYPHSGRKQIKYLIFCAEYESQRSQQQTHYSPDHGGEKKNRIVAGGVTTRVYVLLVLVMVLVMHFLMHWQRFHHLHPAGADCLPILILEVAAVEPALPLCHLLQLNRGRVFRQLPRVLGRITFTYIYLPLSLTSWTYCTPCHASKLFGTRHLIIQRTLYILYHWA